MKRGLIAVAAAVLLLTGCTAQTQEAAVMSDAPAGASAPTPQAATPAPAAPVEVTATTPPAQDEDAAQFLIKLQLAMANDGVKMTAAETQSAADYACDQIASGADESAIVALTGAVHEQTNADFVSLANQGYCPIR